MGKTGTKAATSSARRGTADENDVGLQLKLNGKPYKELVKIAHPRSFAIRKPLLSRFKVDRYYWLCLSRCTLGRGRVACAASLVGQHESRKSAKHAAQVGSEINGVCVARTNKRHVRPATGRCAYWCEGFCTYYH
jgi:hypothetical protein